MLVCTSPCPAASLRVCLQVLNNAQWPDTKQIMLETATTAELPVGLIGFWESMNTVGMEPSGHAACSLGACWPCCLQPWAPAGHADCRPERLQAKAATGDSLMRTHTRHYGAQSAPLPGPELTQGGPVRSLVLVKAQGMSDMHVIVTGLVLWLTENNFSPLSLSETDLMPGTGR